MSDESFIAINNVTKRFGPVAAVDHVSMGIKRGEFFSLLGPSGCGKTTLLRMIAGFEFPTEGAILIDGQDVSGVPANKRPTNMVFQSYAIFPHLNVRDNIAYGLRRDKLSRKELDKRVNDALGMIRLPGFGSRAADQLSGGQRQRVALARALIKRPKVLLLDEPLGALDKKLREEMQIELRQLQKTVGITFVFVTHDQEEALSMSDRIAVMAKGKVLQIASPRELYEAPNCREVADFIGTMNVIAGTVRSVSGGQAVIETEGIGQVRAELPAGVTQGAKVMVAIRPEKISISPAAEGTHSVPGSIVASAYLGDRSHFQVKVTGRQQPLHVVASQSQRFATEHGAESKVYVSFEPDSLVVLTF